jgi:hypothetical protein
MPYAIKGLLTVFRRKMQRAETGVVHFAKIFKFERHLERGNYAASTSIGLATRKRHEYRPPAELSWGRLAGAAGD